MPIVLLQTPTVRTYDLTAGSVVNKVRHILQDRDSASYRHADEELWGWLDDAIRSVLVVIPSLFYKIGNHVCQASYRQTVGFDRANSFVEVVGVPYCDLKTLTAVSPGWQTSASGAIKNWTKIEGDKLSFYCYPPAPAGQLIPILYVEAPAVIVSESDPIPLPESFEPALVEYVAGMAQLKDDESLDMQRQQLLMATFIARINGEVANVQSKQ